MLGFPTRLHQVLHGGEALVDSSADGAVDEDPRQIGIPHQGPSGQPGGLVPTTDMTSN